jgi:hypothetical protein
MELELGMLGIAKKLVEDVVQLWWWDFEEDKNSTSYKLSK